VNVSPIGGYIKRYPATELRYLDLPEQGKTDTSGDKPNAPSSFLKKKKKLLSLPCLLLPLRTRHSELPEIGPGIPSSYPSDNKTNSLHKDNTTKKREAPFL